MDRKEHQDPVALIEPERLAGDHCVVHGQHRPVVRETELHHVWPKGMGGPDVKANKIAICPTGHANVHRAMRKLIDGLPVKVTVDGTKTEIELAHSGFAQWDAAGRPGKPE